MHYKNGREAKDGDHIIEKHYNQVLAGVLHSTITGSESCNGQISFPIPGGFLSWPVTVGECFHAEDAFACIEAEWEISQTAMKKANADPAIP